MASPLQSLGDGDVRNPGSSPLRSTGPFPGRAEAQSGQTKEGWSVPDSQSCWDTPGPVGPRPAPGPAWPYLCQPVRTMPCSMSEGPLAATRSHCMLFLRWCSVGVRAWLAPVAPLKALAAHSRRKPHFRYFSMRRARQESERCDGPGLSQTDTALVQTRQQGPTAAGASPGRLKSQERRDACRVQVARSPPARYETSRQNRTSRE